MGKLILGVALLLSLTTQGGAEDTPNLWDTYDQIIEQNQREQQNQTVTRMQRDEPWRFQDLERLRPQPKRPTLRVRQPSAARNDLD